MAEMNGEDRGQLLLVAGILLAVVFVALALLVNTAIYTDNVATRGGDAAGEAIEYQAGVTDAVGGLLDAENDNPEHENRDDIRDAIEDGTIAIDGTVQRNNLRRGAITGIDTTISEAETTSGTLIRQKESVPIEDWNVSDSSGVRAFDIAIEADSVDDDRLNITLGPSKLLLAENGDSLTVALNSPDNVICETEASGTVRFAVTDGRFGDEPCRFQWPDIDDDETGFETDGEINATYNLTVATEAELETAEGIDGPDTTEAIYSIDGLGISIDTPELRYETSVRIAPGEPDA